jgi:hypothetical protein
MLVKSNSVPNFLFEKPVSTRRYSLVLTNKKKIVSYGEFIKNNPNSTKIERREAIKSFYEILFSVTT